MSSQPDLARSPTDARERFAPGEIDAVLARYELGAVRSVRELARGTPVSPKAVVECARGTLLLKRRARGVDAPDRVAFSHDLMLSCLRRGVCVPPLVGTRDANNSMVQVGDDRVYELFVFIEGGADPRTPAAAEGAGSLLGELHAAMDAAAGSLGWPAPVEGAAVDPGRADGHPGLDDEVRPVIRGVLERAARRVPGDDRGLVHGDWHPGNLVFRGDEPVAVCDFDHARLGSRTREVAQGLAQFSLKRGGPSDPPERWPAEADLERLAAHWRGYAAAAPRPIDAGAAAGLMPGVLLDEVLGAGAPDPRLVWMALRKAQWLEDRAEEIAGLLA